MSSPTTSRRGAVPPDLPLRLDRAVGSRARQLHAGLRAAILDGRLGAGIRLPSSRALADQFGVDRNAVVAAYERLQGEGLVEARRGAGTFVMGRVPALPAVVARRDAAPDVAGRTLALGRTAVEPDLLRRLAASVRRRLARADGGALGYGDPRGSARLRGQIALHLAASRGISCDPDCVVVVSGTRHGLRLCIDTLLRPGDDVWFEDPGYADARRALEAAGLSVMPVPVDREGLDVAAGLRSRPLARAAYVTPSNQFPTGAKMTMERRGALIAWARDAGAWILEDDYDNEFRYGGPPLTALAGLAGDRVAYLGTFSKSLFPGLRLAYVVFPPMVAGRAAEARAAHHGSAPALTEDAVADLMADGSVAANTRRMRARYRAARDALRDALAAAAGDALRIEVPRQGLHILAHLPPGLPPGAGRRIRDAARVEARLIEELSIAPGAGDGFVLGFAGHERAGIVEAAAALGCAAKLYVESARRA